MRKPSIHGYLLYLFSAFMLLFCINTAQAINEMYTCTLTSNTDEKTYTIKLILYGEYGMSSFGLATTIGVNNNHLVSLISNYGWSVQKNSIAQFWTVKGKDGISSEEATCQLEQFDEQLALKALNFFDPKGSHNSGSINTYNANYSSRNNPIRYVGQDSTSLNIEKDCPDGEHTGLLNGKKTCCAKIRNGMCVLL
ncbi:MAG: hypothetical protein K0R14_2025 [Burkholderiales bacterium]|nr:hypothetical protein [Burkholderiales bacterium]